MQKVRTIVIHQHGNAPEVASVEDWELPAPQPHEARVRMVAAPINPVDLNVIEGTYPVRPALPAVPGAEGAGVVVEVGAAVTRVRAGDLVLLPPGVGTWREQCVAAADDLVVVPPGIAPEQAAMLRINPATALRMLRDFVPLGSGEWVLQNAGNSGVGRAVSQIGQHLGLRVFSVVRRSEAIEEVAATRTGACFLDYDDLPAAIDRVVAGAPIRLALNAIGGESVLRLANALAPGGTIVTYGAMARKPLRIPNGLLIFKDLCWRGFWITGWYRRADPAARAAMFEELFALAQRGVIHSKIERAYPLEAATAALAHAARGARAGKILFACDAEVLARFAS